jgi:hypothetical protein
MRYLLKVKHFVWDEFIIWTYWNTPAGELRPYYKFNYTPLGWLVLGIPMIVVSHLLYLVLLATGACLLVTLGIVWLVCALLALTLDKLDVPFPSTQGLCSIGNKLKLLKRCD